MNLPQQPTEEVYRYAFAQVAAGVRPFDVQRQLVDNGWAPQTAAFVMDHVRRTMQSSATQPTSTAQPTHTSTASYPNYAAQGHPQGYARAQPQQHGYIQQNAGLQNAGHQNYGHQNYGHSGAQSDLGSDTGSRVPIPWTVYRDLAVGLLALFIALLMVVAGVSPFASFFAGLFGLIQIIRAVVIGGLSMYRV